MQTTFQAGTLPTGRVLIHGAVAVLAFHLAYSTPRLSGLVVAYLFCLIQMARAETWRRAFYPALAVGLLIAGPQLHFFWAIFGGGAVALWLILAFWIGLFVALSRLCLVRWGPACALWLVPFLWTGLEYFRSELYHLRFSWLNIGYAFSDHLTMLPVAGQLGMYGAGFLVAAVAAGLSCLSLRRAGLAGLALVTMVALLPNWPAERPALAAVHDEGVVVAGVQMEFPTDDEVLAALDQVVKAVPNAELLVLSEYTFQDSVPERVKRWCRDHRLHLIAGGKDPVAGGEFYNTAFVVGPDGEIVFRQVKSVPIQFFKDGLPAPEQQLWESPWGRIGICICYDLSYTRVTDRLIQQGAEALVVPTMDVADWGRQQHELHARVAPVRAAEYGVPIFRVASSGVSQLVDGSGRVIAKAGFPGEREIIAGRMYPAGRGSLPVDRWLTPMATGVAVILIAWVLLGRGLPYYWERCARRGDRRSGLVPEQPAVGRGLPQANRAQALNEGPTVAALSLAAGRNSPGTLAAQQAAPTWQSSANKPSLSRIRADLNQRETCPKPFRRQ